MDFIKQPIIDFQAFLPGRSSKADVRDCQTGEAMLFGTMMKMAFVLIFVLAVFAVNHVTGFLVIRRSLETRHAEERSGWERTREVFHSELEAEREKVRVLGERLHALAVEASAAERSLNGATSALAADQSRLAQALEEEQLRAASAAALVERAVDKEHTAQQNAYAEGWNAAIAAINTQIEAAQGQNARPNAIYIQNGPPPPAPPVPAK